MMSIHVMTTHQHIEAYMDHLRVERRLSERVILSHARALAAAAQIVAHYRWPLEMCPPEHVYALVSMRPGLEPTLRDFYRFLVIDRRIDRDPMVDR